WADVRVIDADALEAWLEATPAVHYWLSEELGFRPNAVTTLEKWWSHFSMQTDPHVPPALLLAGRERQVEDVKRQLESPPQVVGIQAGSRTEAIAFLAAARVGDSKLHRGAIVVRAEEVWARVSASTAPMVMVADFDAPPIAVAVERGHHVVVPLGREDIGRGAAIELPPIHRLLAEQALREAEPAPGRERLSFEEAGLLAGLARRSLTSFVRRRAIDPRAVRPKWGEGEPAATFGPLLLVGAFTERAEDRDLVSEIAGVDWDALEQALRLWSVTSDPPFTRSGSGWHLTSPEEAFDVLHPFLTRTAIARWQRVVLRALTETDPSLDLPPEKTLFAEPGARPLCSGELRKGLVRGMALLGGFGESVGPDAPSRTLADEVDALVREVFSRANADGTGLLWRSLSGELPSLAEAAPSAFLDAVEAASLGSEPLLASMFGDKSDQAAFLASSPHTGLLWALETVSWSAEFMPRALIVLARLASIDPGGRLANRPAASLRAVLLPWVPYTSATMEQRLAAFRQVARVYPEVAWPLALALLPKFHDHSSPTSRPRFRDWRPDRERVTVAEWIATVEGLVDYVLEALLECPARWVEVVGRVSSLPSHLRARVLDQLAGAVAESSFREGDELSLWKALTQELDRHREFPGADWVMDDNSLARIDEIAAMLAPEDAATRSAKLFDWRPRLDGLSATDHAQYDTALSDAQEHALREVLDSDGIEGVFRLAAESPQAQFVGWALAAVDGAEHAEQLLPLLADTNKSGDMARGWARRMGSIGGADWILATRDEIRDLAPEVQASFLLQSPSSDGMEELLGNADEPVRELYWRAANPYGFAPEEVEFAVAELIAHGRAIAAVELLAAHFHRDAELPPAVSLELIVEVLRAVLRVSADEADGSGLSLYAIGVVMDRLESLGASEDELAQLEWAYFPALEHSSHTPKALYAALKRDPDFFVDLVSLVYRGKGEPSRDADPAEAAQAGNAWSVLHAWRELPGVRDDGSVDRDHLHRWVHRARLALDERDRADIGDEVIGQVLSAAPIDDADGAWPAIPVRELIEAIGSRQLETGVHIGRINSRGVTTRGVYDGGTQEREIAKGYRKWAATTRAMWPRTTRLLDGLADSYERDADRLDAEADALGNRD
ncbi:MAG TPA: hypothetical protein VKT78_04480, partial [Fimbriimonadaceae bacterium]|nr:hypothetical protein [Fimbriimonadaceae bacterium]